MDRLDREPSDAEKRFHKHMADAVAAIAQAGRAVSLGWVLQSIGITREQMFMNFPKYLGMVDAISSHKHKGKVYYTYTGSHTGDEENVVEPEVFEECPKCGSTDYHIPDGALSMGESEPRVCNDCGADWLWPPLKTGLTDA